MSRKVPTIGEASKARLLACIEDLQARLDKTERALRAARNGETGTTLAPGKISSRAEAPQNHDPLLRGMVDAIRMGFVTISNDNLILECNDFFSDMVGIPMDRLVGSCFLDLLNTAGRKSFTGLAARGPIKRSTRKLALRTAQGRDIFVRLADGRDSHSSSCVVVTDTSGLRTVEKLLRARNDGLERRVKERTLELQKALKELEGRFEERSRGLAETKRALIAETRRCSRLEESLDAKSHALEEVNTALKVLLKQREEERKELEKSILLNVKELILPYLGKLKRARLNAEQTSSMGIIEANLDRIMSPLVRKMQRFDLTPKEIEVVSYLKDGRTTKQIAELLGVTPRAIEFHRYNIRKKLRLGEKKANLRAYLLSLPDSGD